MKTTLIVAAALFARGAFAQRAARPEPEYVPGEILIKFVPDAPQAAIFSARDGVGANEVDRFAGLDVRHWKLGQGVSVEAALKVLAAPGLQRSIEYAEPNYLYHAFGAPDDPDFGRLWGLYNGGLTGGTKGADVHAAETWMAGFTGSQNVVVAVLDTGIDYNHPDLAANIWTNPGEIPGNGIDDDGNGYVDDVRGWDFASNDNDPMDEYGHGTHVAGTIGGSGNNGLGVVGVNWTVKLMALKWLDATGSGTSANAIKAINYAAAKKVKITSNSWGGFSKSKAMQDAIKNSGALFVAAAGNYGSSSVSYPAGYTQDLTNVLAVAATDHQDQLASFSTFGSWVQLAAPGVDVYSTYPDGDYAKASGTSMAAPHASGAAALLMAQNPTLSIVEVKNRLLQNVDVLSSLSGKVSTGGRLNVQKALGAPAPAVPIVYLAKAELTAEANGNGWADAGESITLTLTLGNLRFAAAPAVSATLSANSVPLGTQSAGDLAPDGTAALVFSFEVDSAAGSSPTLNLTLDTSINGAPHRSLPFSLPLGPRDVLLVNGAGAYESFYTRALMAGGYSYQALRTFDEAPTADEMSRFKAVVWFTDYVYPEEQPELADYLEGQGRYPNPPRLFVTGQDIGWNMGDPAYAYESDLLFYETYLHARYLRDDSNIFDVVGIDDPLAGLAISTPLSAGDGARNQWYQDEIAAIAPATPLLRYSGDGQAAVKYDAGGLRMIYFAFGFEAIDSTNPATATRADVLGSVLDWLLEVPAGGDYRPVAVPKAPPSVVAVAPAASVDVTLDGSQSYDIGGTVVQHRWSEGATLLGVDPVITPTLSFGTHQLTLTVTDDTGNSGSSTVQVKVLQRLFSDDMETTGTTPWQTQGNTRDSATRNSPPTPGTSNLWHKTTRRGTDDGHSPVRSWYYGIDSQGNYDTGYRNWGRLISPALAIPQNGSRVVLNVSQLVNVEGNGYETATIQISTDNGSTWTTLLSRATQNTFFVREGLDLSSYLGRTVRIGFFIDTRDRVGNSFEGWYLDDVTLTLVP
jgi:subtilisin family serine protease